MLKYKIEISPLGSRYVVAAKDPEKGTIEQVFTLNETATQMLKLFSEGMEAAEVAKQIAKNYNAPAELVKRDVDLFWDNLIKKGLV